MIYDVLENSELYAATWDRLAIALEWLKGFDPSEPDGKYPIVGDDIIASVDSYQSRKSPNTMFESHEKYVDLQFVLEGNEYIDVAVGEALIVAEAYDAKRDVAFWGYDGAYSRVVMRSGSFAVLWPGDVHRPCQQIDKPEPIRKIVVKIRL